jgi:O-antigen/teichoic acid export membrane protein
MPQKVNFNEYAMNKKLISSAFLCLSITNIMFVVNFVGGVAIARMIGPGLYGDFIYVAAIQGIVTTLFSMPIQAALINSDRTQHVFNSAWTLTAIVCLTLIVSGLVGCSILWFSHDMQTGVFFLFLCISQCPLAFTNLYMAQFEKDMNYLVTLTIAAIASALGISAAILTAWFGGGAWSPLVRECLGPFILFFLIRRVTKAKFTGKNEKVDLLSFFRDAKVMHGARILESLFFRGSFVLVGSIFGSSNLGAFSQAFNVASLPNSALSPLSERVAFNSYAHSGHTSAAVASGLFATNFLVIRSVILMSLIFAVCNVNIMVSLFGNDWESADKIFVWFLVFAAINPLFSSVKSACLGYKRAEWVIIAYAFAIVSLVSAMWVSFKVDNLKILALGYGLALLLGIIYMFRKLSNFGIDLRLFNLFRSPLIFLLMVVLTFPFKYLVSGRVSDTFYFALLICVYLYLILVYDFEDIRSILSI